MAVEMKYEKNGLTKSLLDLNISWSWKIKQAETVLIGSKIIK